MADNSSASGTTHGGAQRPSGRLNAAFKAGQDPLAQKRKQLEARAAAKLVYFQAGYATLKTLTFIQSCVIAVLIVFLLLVAVNFNPENNYFIRLYNSAGASDTTQDVPMIAMAEPNMSKPALLDWASQAATETLTFGFNDYSRRLPESARHFTKEGWVSFVKAIEKAKLLTAIEKNRQIVSAAPRATPTIVGEGLSNGQYVWQVEIPMMITTQLGAQKKDSASLIRLSIVRVPKSENPHGLGIQRWEAQ